MLEASDLQCVRGERTLFSGLACRIPPSSLLRVAGPNGTGKTSLLRVLCGLLAPTAGEVCWTGRPIGALKEAFWKDLAYIGHLNAVKDDLTVAENLSVACQIAGLATTPADGRAALASVGLAGFEDAMARFLSQGQRRRIALARLFVSGAVPLWILDEPFTALDVRGVTALADLIARHLRGGGSVVLTTHQEVAIDAAASAVLELGQPGAVAC